MPIFAASSLVRRDALDDPADYRPDHACDDEFDTRRQFGDLNENALRYIDGHFKKFDTSGKSPAYLHHRKH
jgi:hypothetical protein